MALTPLSLTEQQRQPLDSSSHSSVILPLLTDKLLSMPELSPKSFKMTAILLLILGLLSIDMTRVVFPDPKNPVIMVTGTLFVVSGGLPSPTGTNSGTSIKLFKMIYCQMMGLNWLSNNQRGLALLASHPTNSSCLWGNIIFVHRCNTCPVSLQSKGTDTRT